MMMSPVERKLNATMYREAGACLRVYFNPQTTVVQCMLYSESVSLVFHNGEG